MGWMGDKKQARSYDRAWKELYQYRFGVVEVPGVAFWSIICDI
jgi:hypothetical protein